MKTVALPVTLALVLASASAWAMTPKDVYKKVGPAVVLILGSDDGKSGSGGTGSIITPEGKIITNAHVVLNERLQPFKILYVFLKPPKITGDNAKDLANRYKARVLSYSVPDELDLALLQLENPPPALPTVSFGNPDDVDIGEQALAIGHPEQAGLWTLTTGTVSTVISNFNRIQGKDVFQTDASVNRGNSGGPLLDDNGELIGINTMIARQGAGGIAITGVNFSLKSSVAVKWLAGQGMGLAYAPKGAAEPVVVAQAEPPRRTPTAPAETRPAVETRPAAETAVVADTKPVATKPAETKPAEVKPVEVKPAEVKPVAEQPPSTIVLAEPPPKKDQVAQFKEEAKTLGKEKAPEKTKGKPFDPKKAKPKYETEKRPFSLDDLRKQQMKEMEDIMDEMRGKVDEKRKSGDGMGLW